MRTKHKYTQTHTQQPLFPLKAWLHQDDSRPLSLLDKDSVSWDDVTTAFLMGVNLCLVEQQQKNLCVALNPHAFGRMKASSALFCCSMWLSSLSFLPLPFLSFEIPAFFFSISLLSTFYFALFLFHPGSSCLLSLRIFTFLFFVVVFFTSLLTVFFPPLTPLPVSVTLDFYISTLLLAAHSLYGLSSLFFSLVFQHPTKLPALLMTASNIWIQLLATWEMPNSDALSPNNLVCIKGHVNNVDVGQLVCGMDLGTN